MNAAPDRRDFEAAMAAPPPAPVAAAELISVLWRWRWGVAGAGAAAFALAAMVLALQPSRYVAQAEILLEGRMHRVVDLASVTPEAPMDAQAVQSEIRLVQSQQLLARVARALDLSADPEFGGAELDPAAAVTPFPARAIAEARGAARTLAERLLGWRPPPEPAPPSAREAELRAVAALRRRLEVRQQDLSRVIAVRVRADDPDKAALLANAIADQYIVDQLEAKFEATERAARWLAERLTDLSARLEEAEAAAEAQRARMAADPAGALAATRRRMGDLAAALSVAEAAPGGPDPARTAALRQAIGLLEAEAEAQGRGDIVLRQLDREAEALAALHRAFLARLGETHAQIGLERPDARLIAEAAPPLQPSDPNARLILAFALAGGLALGGAGAFLRESLGGVHHSAAAAERDTGLPVLAALPPPEPRGADPVEAVRRKPGSRLAEAVRDLRAGALRGAEGPLTLAVVSAGEGEGRSALAAQIAESCARLGRRTLLVDGDLRAPAQAVRYGLEGEAGLGALLAGTATLDEVLWIDPDSGLTVLPAQPVAAAEADLLAGPALAGVLAALRGRFEVTVIDTPPLLAAADARLIAAQADRCVVALRWGRTGREDLHGALRLLAEAGAVPIGLALTDAPRRASSRPGRRAVGPGRWGDGFDA